MNSWFESSFVLESIIIIIMWFLGIAEELSVGFNSPVEDSPFVLSPRIPDCVILLSTFLRLRAVFFASRIFTWYNYWLCYFVELLLRLQTVFLRLELPRGTTTGCQAVVDLKLEVK